MNQTHYSLKSLMCFVSIISLLGASILGCDSQPQKAPRPKLILAGSRDNDQVTSIAVSMDGRYVLLGCGFCEKASLWDLAQGKEIRRFNGPIKHGVDSVALSSDGQLALTGCGDEAKLWDVSTGNELRSFRGHADTVFSVAFSPDGIHVATGSMDGTARLWNTSTGKEIRRFQGHTDGVWSVGFSRDGRQFVTGSKDKTARLWDISTGKELHCLRGHSDFVVSVVFSPDGKHALSGSWDTTARLWDTATGQEVRKLKGDEDWVWAVTFSPDGRNMLTRTSGIARVWDTLTGREIRNFQGEFGTSSIGFTLDGNFIFMGGTYGQLFDVTHGKRLCTLMIADDDNWAVTDDEGRYDSSKTGDIPAYWRVGEKWSPLSKLKQEYFDPGLLAKRLGFKKEALLEIPP